MSIIKLISESEQYYSAIKSINDSAFEGENESLLIENIRKNPLFIEELSIIAFERRTPIGHILLFPVIIIDKNNEPHKSLSLAPLSVVPDCQKQGIGKMLVKEAIKRAKNLRFTSIFVLGHPEYYTKFGFVKASKFSINLSFDVPDDIFMALELKTNTLKRCAGKLIYPKEYDVVM